MVLQYLFFFLVYPSLLFLSLYLGGLYSKRRIKQSKVWKSIGLESSLVGIYALLLSFSLVLSSNHAEDRNKEIYNVADKLSILVKKSKYYDVPLKTNVQNYLRQFFLVHDKNLKANGLEKEVVVAKIIELDQQLDNFMIDYQRTNPNSKQEISEITTYLSNLRSSYIRLTESYGQSTPTIIILILIFYSLLIGFLIGFMTVIDNNQTYIISSIFLIISTIMVAAIWDQDHPSLGFIQPNYQSITDVSYLFNSYLKNQ
ncbi:hypothetical protein [Pedobacter frigiditerrae]|uniref:hypothetical protein n=1 Tax=Pedobacter frigiditerrae TaxID=2530452 RepID=UPI002930FE76|nr:hypothetical protein [Pedobacter frigiditerrae]